jgi:tRNA threonylcarbamoyladenosine biosynthesis protein TsaE
MAVIELKSLEHIDRVAIEFINLMGSNKVFAFYGEMGAGKTTFIKAVCKAMGVTDNITSPTFALVNEYACENGEPIYHFDCYRLKNIAEAYDIGLEEYLWSGRFCFIEWPEKIKELLPPHCVDVQIKTLSDNSRRIVVGDK